MCAKANRTGGSHGEPRRSPAPMIKHGFRAKLMKEGKRGLPLPKMFPQGLGRWGEVGVIATLLLFLLSLHNQKAKMITNNI